MTDLPLFPDAPVPSRTPERERDRVLAAHRAKAGRRFLELAGALMVSHLRRCGPTSGEVLVDECKAAGIKPPADDRAFGAVFMSLVRRGEIVKVGSCPRRKGHLTAGGSVYAAAT